MKISVCGQVVTRDNKSMTFKSIGTKIDHGDFLQRLKIWSEGNISVHKMFDFCTADEREFLISGSIPPPLLSKRFYREVMLEAIDRYSEDAHFGFKEVAEKLTKVIQFCQKRTKLAKS